MRNVEGRILYEFYHFIEFPIFHAPGKAGFATWIGKGKIHGLNWKGWHWWPSMIRHQVESRTVSSDQVSGLYNIRLESTCTASQRWAHHPGGIVSGGVKHRCFNHVWGWVKWLNGYGLRILDADSQVWSGFHMIVNVSQRVLLNFRDVGFCWEVMGPKPTGMYITVQ